MYEGLLQSVNRDKLSILMARGVKFSENGPYELQFTRDFRLKFQYPLVVPHDVTMILIKQIKAAYLYIKSDDNIYVEPEKIAKEALQQFRECNPHFEMVRVSGTHHVHLNDPHLVADKIGEFIQKYYMSDYSASNKKILNKL